MSDKIEVTDQSDPKQEEAEQLKNQANDHFKSIFWSHHFMWTEPNLKNINKKKTHFAEKEYDKAIDFYTKAIELVPKNAVYYANRSLAHLRQESFGFALQDAVNNFYVFFVKFFFAQYSADNKKNFRWKKKHFLFCLTDEPVVQTHLHVLLVNLNYILNENLNANHHK